MTPRDGSVLAFAGLWSAWGTGDRPLITCSVLTTAARGALADVHDRMPVPVPVRRWAEWLNGPFESVILPTLTTDQMIDGIEIRPVRPDVGNVRHNGSQLTEPIPIELGQDHDSWTLF
jgi:putative SOS response-associated peptidase YedK